MGDWPQPPQAATKPLTPINMSHGNPLEIPLIFFIADLLCCCKFFRYLCHPNGFTCTLVLHHRLGDVHFHHQSRQMCAPSLCGGELTGNHWRHETL